MALWHVGRLARRVERRDAACAPLRIQFAICASADYPKRVGVVWSCVMAGSFDRARGLGAGHLPCAGRFWRPWPRVVRDGGNRYRALHSHPSPDGGAVWQPRPHHRVQHGSRLVAGRDRGDRPRAVEALHRPGRGAAILGGVLDAPWGGQVVTPECSRCDDTGWVCENHPDRPWLGRHACECGGPDCNTTDDISAGIEEPRLPFTPEDES
jgi:hypothetical protein